ncbi:hypothetical protein DFH28DRAFT_847301, partial [Melampsora americana]
NEIYLPFVYALFTFILAINLLGIIPYTFTVAAVVSLGISVTNFILTLHKHEFFFKLPKG